MNTASPQGVSEIESILFLALRTEDWLLPEDLMARAGVAVATARAWCERFWQMGVVVRRGAYPSYRYRALRVPLNDAGRAYLRSIAEQKSPSLGMDCAEGWPDSNDLSDTANPVTAEGGRR